MTFILITYFFLLYWILKNGHYENPCRTYVVAITIALIFISGFRHEGVGNDTYAVMQRFEEFGDMSWREIFGNFFQQYFNPTTHMKDPGEQVFDKLASYVIPNPRVFLIVVALFFLSVLGWFVYKHANSLFSILFTYTFFISLFYQYIPNSSFRQTMALAFLLIAFNCLEDKKLLYTVLWIVLASIFHKSALVALAIIPLSYVRNVRLVYIWSMLLFLIVLINYQWVGALLGAASEVYDEYVDSTYFINKSRPVMVIILIVGLYLVGLLFSRDDKNYYKNRLYYYGTAITLCLVPLVWVDPTALRLLSYFGIYMGLLIGNSELLNNKAKLLLRLVIIVFAIKALVGKDDYHFMWQEMELHERYAYVELPQRAKQS